METSLKCRVKTSCKYSFENNQFIIFTIAIACFHWERRKYNHLQSCIKKPMLKGEKKTQQAFHHLFLLNMVKMLNNHVAFIRLDPDLSRSTGGLHRTSCCRGYNRALDLPDHLSSVLHHKHMVPVLREQTSFQT